MRWAAFGRPGAAVSRLQRGRAAAARRTVGRGGDPDGDRGALAPGLRRRTPCPVHEHDAQGGRRHHVGGGHPARPHFADATADAIRATGLSRVGLLATAYTMEQDFYVGRLRRHHGLDVVVPNRADRQSVHDIIYNELCLGVLDDGSRDRYREIMRRLVEQVLRESCSAAPKSISWSAPRMLRCPCSTRRCCMSGRPWTSHCRRRGGHR